MPLSRYLRARKDFTMSGFMIRGNLSTIEESTKLSLWQMKVSMIVSTPGLLIPDVIKSWRVTFERGIRASYFAFKNSVLLHFARQSRDIRGGASDRRKLSLCDLFPSGLLSRISSCFFWVYTCELRVNIQRSSMRTPARSTDWHTSSRRVFSDWKSGSVFEDWYGTRLSTKLCKLMSCYLLAEMLIAIFGLVTRAQEEDLNE